ncbi:MAG: 30S ribosomal protein S6 [Polyangiaceae bacterium]|nr:30S ribosomal protein S6 [Polyangiaceae bacterium]MCB9606970.1 30S ribosomal protein S6 [Polyangiaceae bacterium]
MAAIVATAPSRVREYETIYVMRPDVARDAAERVSQRVQEVMEREGARLSLVETWGRRALAYKVNKHRHGIYVYLKFLAGGTTVSELERNFRLLDEVIKFQTIVLGNVEGDVEISSEAVAFEAVEGIPAEEDEAHSLARELGLEDPEPGSRYDRRNDDDDSDDDDDDESSETEEEEEE